MNYEYKDRDIVENSLHGFNRIDESVPEVIIQNKFISSIKDQMSIHNNNRGGKNKEQIENQQQKVNNIKNA